VIVYAQSCQETACTGHYFAVDIQDCCAGDGIYLFFYSDPSSANFEDGFHYTGGISCGIGGCPGMCEQGTCVNG